MNDTALTFTTDGVGHSLYTEIVDLSAIGPLSIRRATRIEYDNQAQHWRVYLAHGRVAMFSSPSRQACLEWERRYLESKEDMEHELQRGPGAVATGS